MARYINLPYNYNLKFLSIQTVIWSQFEINKKATNSNVFDIERILNQNMNRQYANKKKLVIERIEYFESSA